MSNHGLILSTGGQFFQIRQLQWHGMLYVPVSAYNTFSQFLHWNILVEVKSLYKTGRKNFGSNHRVCKKQYQV